MEFNERSAYPHPDEFKVMRPEYTELEDGTFQATITIAPFKVVGQSVSKPGARRAAIYEAAKTYMDTENTKWKQLSGIQKERNGDYAFYDEDGEEDFADTEQLLAWDVRPASIAAK